MATPQNTASQMLTRVSKKVTDYKRKLGYQRVFRGRDFVPLIASSLAYLSSREALR